MVAENTMRHPIFVSFLVVVKFSEGKLFLEGQLAEEGRIPWRTFLLDLTTSDVCI